MSGPVNLNVADQLQQVRHLVPVCTTEMWPEVVLSFLSSDKRKESAQEGSRSKARAQDISPEDNDRPQIQFNDDFLVNWSAPERAGAT